MNKDQVNGHLTEAKGKVKEVTGKVIGNKTLEEKGRVEKNVGSAQADLGDVREATKKATEKAIDRLQS